MWIPALQVTTLTLVAMAMAFALAHAAEMPGKRRLDRAAYFKVQTIYYPGFTIGGVAEPLAIIALAALAYATYAAQRPLWPVLAALILVAAMQVIFWLAVQPVNRVWMAGKTLPAAGEAFFGTTAPPPEDTSAGDWKRLRNRWEYAHAARAVIGLTALILTAASLLCPN